MTGSAVANLTDKQQDFVKHFVAGLNQTEAAKLAGFACPGQDAWRLMRTPSVAAAVRAETTRLLLTDARTRSVATLIRLLEPSNPPAVQRAAANDILNHSQKVAESLGLGKPIDELSETELAALAAALRPHGDAGMVDITPDTPKSGAAPDSQPLGIIDEQDGQALP